MIKKNVKMVNKKGGYQNVGYYCNMVHGSGVLQLNNINFFETLDIALFFLSIFLYFLFVLFGTL